jgi:hypothetical protein
MKFSWPCWFIKDFSHIAKLLTSLLAKDVPFEFDDACLLGILNAHRKIRKRTDSDVAFTSEYSIVSISMEN